MNATKEITIKHLVKYMRSKLKKGWHGTIMIKVEDGKIKLVTGQDTFNTSAFIDHCEQLPNRYVVRSCSVPKENSVPEKGHNVTKKGKNGTIRDQELPLEKDSLSEGDVT